MRSELETKLKLVEDQLSQKKTEEKKTTGWFY